MTAKNLRSGLLVLNSETDEPGMVIDWGIKDLKLERYVALPAYNKMAQWVRVRTSSGKTLEVWPLESVRFTGFFAGKT